MHLLTIKQQAAFSKAHRLGKTKNTPLKLLFIGLALLSFLNVFSLAVRLDWSYEEPSQLFSYDYALLPVLEDKQNPCAVKLDSSGYLLDVCDCEYAARLVRGGGEFFFFACAKKAGKDGLFLNYSFDNISFSKFIPSNVCESVGVNATSKVVIFPVINGSCEGEMVSIRFSDL